MRNMFILIFAAYLAAGCAKVEVTRITAEHPYTEGIRFYRPHPYLLVTKEKQGDNLECKVVFLPNVNEEYVVRSRSGIGSTELKLTLEEGWNLTQFGETRDSKSPEMLAALTGSLKAAAELLKIQRADILKPGLYAFVFDDKTGLVNDLKPVLQFN